MTNLEPVYATKRASWPLQCKSEKAPRPSVKDNQYIFKADNTKTDHSISDLAPSKRYRMQTRASVSNTKHSDLAPNHSDTLRPDAKFRIPFLQYLYVLPFALLLRDLAQDERRAAQRHYAATTLSLKHPRSQQVHRIWARLTQHPAVRDARPTSWEIYLTDTRQDPLSRGRWGSTNADGLVHITTEFINGSACCRDDNAIAFIVAHELSHTLFNHSAALLRDSIFFVGAGMALDYCFFPLPIMTVSFVTVLKFFCCWIKRRHEFEADYGAIRLLSDCGFDPHGGIKLLEVLRGLSREGWMKPFAIKERLLSKHPMTNLRVARMKATIERLEAGKDL